MPILRPVLGLLTLLLGGCSGLAAQPSVDLSPRSVATSDTGLALSPAEAAYAAQTASAIYRRATTESLRRLLFANARGYGVCVRSPAGGGPAADYTLLVLQRRLSGEAISQVEDDVLILRAAADAAPCRALGRDGRLWRR